MQADAARKTRALHMGHVRAQEARWVGRRWCVGELVGERFAPFLHAAITDANEQGQVSRICPNGQSLGPQSRDGFNDEATIAGQVDLNRVPLEREQWGQRGSVEDRHRS
jgi:hypothetical protein